jgi:hypothetical protein
MATGYYKEQDIKLKSIDVLNETDQKFLYDVVLYRWRFHETVNITYKTPPTPPTYEQHIQYLKKNNYKEIYRICLGEFAVGTVYIDTNNVFSIFILPNLLKLALKEKKFIKNSNKRLATIVIHKLMKLNSNIKTFYVGINAKNTASLNTAIELQCCYPIEYVLGCTNIFYENGG